MRKVTTVRFDDELKAALQEVADRRGTHVSAIVNMACEQFIRDEGVRDGLASLEASFAASFATLAKETMRVGDDLQLVIAWLDQLTKFQFQATPEVVDKKSAAIIGSRRYKQFLTSFKDVLEGKRRRASVLTEVLDAAEHDERHDDGEASEERDV